MKLSIGGLQWIGGAASALIGLSAVAVIWVLSAQMVREINQRQQALLVGAISNQVQNTFSAHASTIEALVREARVIDAFANPDPARRAELEKQLMSRFANVWDVRLLDAGYDKLDERSSPRLGYADLAMIRESATAAATPLAGAHGVGTEQAHIAMIHPVIGGDGKQVVGHLMVFFNMEIMRSFVSNLASGYVQIRQPKQGGENLLLAEVGDSALTSLGTPLELPIDGSRWQLAYWADPVATSLTNSFRIGLLAIALTMLVLLGLVFLVLHRLSAGKLRTDLATLVTMVRQHAGGGMQDSYPASLAETGASITIIHEILLAESPSRGAKPSAKGKKSALASDPESAGIPDLDL